MKNSTTYKQFKDLDSYQIIKSGSNLNINYYSGSINPESNGASININGDLNVNGVITGSLFGTASFAVSSSFANTASHAPAYLPLTGGTISGNLTVIGTASFAYTTASVVQIGASTITLNTNNPATRFGGLTVIDSGSFGNSSTGSLFWDSLNNKWIYSNPADATYDGGMLISGPRNTSGLGNEQGTTNNALMKGQGGDHITSSGIFEDASGSVTFGNNLLYISSSSRVGIGTTSFVGTIKLAVDGKIGGPTYSSNFVDFTNSITEIRGNSGIGYYAAANNHIFYTGASLEKMRITEAGNVGIGTTSPNARLDVSGSAIITGSLRVTQGITGSLFGTASFATIATNAISSSKIFIENNPATAGTYYPVFVSEIQGHGIAKVDSSTYTYDTVTNTLTVTSSYSNTSLSSSNAVTASYATQALSASWAPTQNIDTSSFATTGSNTFIGNQNITGSFNVTGSISLFKDILSTGSINYTLQQQDTGRILHFTSSTAATVTIPPNLQIGSRFEGKQLGTGQLSFVTGSGVTIRTAATENAKTAEQYSVFAIDWIGAEEYMLYGRLEQA
jgi:hypothetical protein